jgi:hypothetical protein
MTAAAKSITAAKMEGAAAFFIATSLRALFITPNEAICQMRNSGLQRD